MFEPGARSPSGDTAYACVLEDDAELPSDFLSYLHGAVLSKPWELLLVGHEDRFGGRGSAGVMCRLGGPRLHGGRRSAHPVIPPLTTVAYLVRQTAIVKLLDYVYLVCVPVDLITGTCLAVGVDLRVVTPPCVLPQPSFVDKPTIRRGVRRRYARGPHRSPLRSTVSGYLRSGALMARVLQRLHPLPPKIARR